MAVPALLSSLSSPWAGDAPVAWAPAAAGPLGHACLRACHPACCNGWACSSPLHTSEAPSLSPTAMQARAMAICLAVLLGFLAWARTAMPGMPAVWGGLVCFFFCRAAQSLPRALQQLGLLQPGGSAGGAASGDASKAAQQLAEPA